jgi:hypothetical protein
MTWHLESIISDYKIRWHKNIFRIDSHQLSLKTQQYKPTGRRYRPTGGHSKKGRSGQIKPFLN